MKLIHLQFQCHLNFLNIHLPESELSMKKVKTELLYLTELVKIQAEGQVIDNNSNTISTVKKKDDISTK